MFGNKQLKGKSPQGKKIGVQNKISKKPHKTLNKAHNSKGKKCANQTLKHSKQTIHSKKIKRQQLEEPEDDEIEEPFQDEELVSSDFEETNLSEQSLEMEKGDEENEEPIDSSINDTSVTVPSKYVPPHLRNKFQPETDDLSKHAKRIVNKISLANLVSTVQDLRTLYSQNPRKGN